MRNTDFMNLSLPEGADKIDIEILNSDFTAIENLLEQHAIIETMTLNGESVIIGAIGPYIRLQNIDAVQVSIDIGNETYTLASGENVIIRETAENIGIITSGNVHITYFVSPKTYADKEFYTKEKVDELLVEATIEADTELSEMSENPVQNKVITAELANYATTAEVENKVTEKVAEIVAGAPEDFDTLKEMSDWLKNHEDSAAAMNSNIQKNAEDIAAVNENVETLDSNTLKYGMITLYVDSVNGSDDNAGTSSKKLKTIEKAFELSKLYMRIRIYLADGEYGNSQDEYTFYEQLSIIGTSKEGTILKTKLKAIDGTLTLSTLTHDTTGISQDIYPITASYNSCLRIYKCVLKTTGLACVRNEYHSRVYISDSDFATASQYTISNVYQSNVSISDCTNSCGLKINAYKGGIIDMYGSEIECKYNDSSVVVYKDGVQINPVDITDTTNKIITSQIGENIIPFPYYSENGKTTNGAVYTYDDNGIITVDTNGVAVTANAYFGLYNSGVLGLKIGKKYTLSAHIIDGAGKCSLYFANTLSSGSTVDLTAIRSMVSGETYASTFEYSQSDLFEKDTIGLYITPTMGAASSLKIAVMLEEGEVAHSYQPYSLSRKSLRDDILALITLME